MEKLKERIKNKNGVTLIALVVTIIVLLILTGITVSNVLDTDVIKQSKEAVANQKEYEKEETEKLKSIVNGTRIVKDEGQAVAIEENLEEGQEWSKDKVNVKASISKSIPGYELYMKKDQTGTWERVSEVIVDQEDTTVFACLATSVDNANTEHRDMVTMKVEGLDKTVPTQTAPTGTSTTKSITVKCNQEDAKSGIDTIQYILYSADGNTVIETSDWEKGKEHTFNNKAHNTKYKIATKAKDKAGNESESSKVEITTKELVAGTLTLKEENENGAEYTQGEETSANVWVSLNNGNTGSSTYLSEQESAQEVSETNENTIITEDGITKLKVKTTDGYNTVERKYEIVIQKVKPEVELRKGNETGAEYESGTWTNEDVYHKITIDPTAGVDVEKYQFTTDNGRTWNDISNEPLITNVDYESTFPLSYSGKPAWLGDVTANGTYYFDIDGTSLTSAGEHGNKGVNNQTANSYIPIDLRDFEADKELKITINYTISSENNYDFGYATITENTTAPDFNSSTGQFIKVSGVTTTSEKDTTINGGKLYYLHLGYRKDTSQHTNDDTFKINSIKLEGDDLGRWNFAEYTKTGNTVTYKLINNIEKAFKVRAIYSNPSGKKSGASDPFTIKIDKMKPIVTGVANLTSPTKAEIKANIQRRGSPIKGYYISTNNTVPTLSSTWTTASEGETTITNLNQNTTYYIWAKDEAGNISETLEVPIGNVNYLVDDTAYAETLALAIAKANDGSTIKLIKSCTDTSTATFNKNVTFDLQSSIVLRTSTITVGSGKTVTITGNTNGKIILNSGNTNTINNNGTLNIEGNVTIENTLNSYYALRNSSDSSTLNINGGTIKGYYGGINNNNSNSSVNMNDGLVQAEGSTSTYGINNNASNTQINVNGGIVKSNSTTSFSYGIYNNNSTGKINVIGGTIESNTTSGSAYGMYSSINNTIIIGNAEQELSTTSPVVYGKTYGVFLSNATYNFNFNSGVIQSNNSNEKTYNSKITPREGYMPYTYYDYSLRKYCTILTQNVDEITMSHEPTEWTNQDVTATIMYPLEDNTVLQYSENGTTWETSSQPIKRLNISENKTIYARRLDSEENVIEQAEHTISNIDKIKPVVTVTPNKKQYEVLNVSDKVNISYNVTATDEGGSGLKESKYGWSNSSTQEPTSWTNIQNGAGLTRNNTPIGTYYLWLKVEDNAGNKSDIDIIKYTVAKKEPVAKIGSTQYQTIQLAVDAAREMQESGATDITIEIIRDTEEETTVYEGVEVTIDLQGHTVGSGEENATITNNGTLTIVDTNTSNPGKIEHLSGTAIKNNGTLTIGKDDGDISIELPRIYGRKIGIHTTEGVFNYYDGTITGEVPIYKNAEGLPEGFGPVAIEEGELTKTYLAITSQYVARIDYVYYTTLQEAIDECEAKDNNNKQTEIVIIKDIILSEIAKVYMGQNIAINLNNFTIKSNVIDRIITNEGELCITDESVEKNGKIESYNSETSYGIYNESEGKIEIKQGTISSNGKVAYGIYNCNMGTIQITDGIIKCENNGNYTYGIYNYNDGQIRIIGGTISCNSSGITYGIRNERNGIIEMFGGTVDVYGNGIAYGLANTDTGKIKIIDGIINCNSHNNNAYIIKNASKGEIIINGGTLSSTSKLTSYGITNNSSMTVEITGGTLSTNSHDSYSYGIDNTGVGEIRILGGIINSEGKQETYGIYNRNGKLTLIGGELNSINNVNSTSYGVRNDTGTIQITGGVINSSSNSSTYGISNMSGTIHIEDGTINSYCYSKSSNDVCYGIYNRSSGIVEIIKGTINSKGMSNYNSYGIGNDGEGKILIGEKGDGIVSKDNPKITSELIGINNSKDGIIELYDGIIQGKDNLIILGTISKIEDDCYLKEEENDEYKSVYLEYGNNNTNIILNENTNIQYNSLQKAIDDVNENVNNKLKVIQSYYLTESSIEIPENKRIELDLNNNTITSKYLKFNNLGYLEITDSSGDGKLDMQVLHNEGNLRITGGTINTIENSTTNYSNAYYVYGVYNTGSGNIEMTGGNISSQISASRGRSYGIYNNSTGIIKLKGGKVSSRGQYCYGIYNNNIGTVLIDGGTLESNCSAYNNYAIYNAKEGNIQIKNGRIELHNNQNGYNYGVYNSGKGIVEITGGILNIESRYVTYTYGIYNYGEGTTILGTKGDGEVNIINPEINSNGYAIFNKNNNAQIYFYDGIIKGNIKAISGILTEWEENTELSDDLNTATELYLIEEISNVARIGEIEYETLQDAINDCNNIGETYRIELLKNINLSNNSNNTITIQNSQNIFIDMKGHIINSAINEVTIENNGTLEIDNTADNTSIINANSNIVIKNNESGTLRLGNIQIKSNAKGEFNNYKYTVYNLGKLNVNKTEINVDLDYIYCIYNDNTGSVEISDGIIRNNSNIYGIYNNSTGLLKISGGTVDISSNYDTCYGIYNNNTGTIELTGGTIKSISTRFSSYGIYNNNTGTIRVFGGMIDSKSNGYYSYGIYNNNGRVELKEGIINSNCSQNSYGIYNKTGDIVIGTKSDNIISENVPTIYTNKTYGVYNEKGYLYFYDGSIEGDTQAIYGNIEEIEDNTELLFDNIKKVQLQEVESKAIGINSEQYNTLLDAINNCNDNTQTTIKVLRDTVQPGGVIRENKNIIIDLNGHTLTTYSTIKNNGTFKLIDSSGNHSGKLTCSTGTAITDGTTTSLNASTEIVGGTITGNTYGVYGTAIISGGIIDNNTYGAYGNITATGGTFSNNTYGIYNTTIDKVTPNTNISNVTFDSNENGIYSYAGTTTLSNSTFSNNVTGASIGGGTLNITSGAVAGNTYGINATGGITNIGTSGNGVVKTDPIIIGEDYGINATSNAVINMYDGTVKGRTGSVQGYISTTETNYVAYENIQDEYYCTYLVQAGTVTTVAKINSTEFTGLQSAINACMDGEETTIQMVNGVVLTNTVKIPSGKKITIDLNGCAIRTTTLDTLIQNNGELTIIDTNSDNTGNVTNELGAAIENFGTLTIGQNDGTLNTLVPYISGNTYAINNVGTLNFYDGILEGGTSPVNGLITATPSGKSVRQINNGGNVQYILN